jgi:hypothetical protein
MSIMEDSTWETEAQPFLFSFWWRLTSSKKIVYIPLLVLKSLLAILPSPTPPLLILHDYYA